MIPYLLRCQGFAVSVNDGPGRVGPVKAVNTVEHGGLACAVRAYDGKGLPFIDVEIDFEL